MERTGETNNSKTVDMITLQTINRESTAYEVDNPVLLVHFEPEKPNKERVVCLKVLLLMLKQLLPLFFGDIIIFSQDFLKKSLNL